MDSKTRDFLVALLLAALATGLIVSSRDGCGTPEDVEDLPDKPRPTKPAGRADLVALLENTELQRLIRPTLHIDLSPGDESTMRPGLSKMGGLPDLPEGVAAPLRGGRRLDLLAQIDLSELPATDPPHGLPASGVLQFFYDAQEQPWGYDPKDRGGAVVLFHENAASLRRAEGKPAFPARRAAFTPAAQLPDADSLWIGRLGEVEKERFRKLRERLDDAFRAQGHQLLGHPWVIQNAMEEECQLVTNGIYLGGDRPIDPKKAEALKKHADEWRLLLQVDSDDFLNTSWGDAGMVYYWIRREDLDARRFEKIWVILQCY